MCFEWMHVSSAPEIEWFSAGLCIWITCEWKFRVDFDIVINFQWDFIETSIFLFNLIVNYILLQYFLFIYFNL